MSPFGILSDGRPVGLVSLASDRLRVELLDFGARLHSVRLDGGPSMVVSGALPEYEGQMIYAGPIVGPVANRIAGAGAVIDGVLCRFTANDGRNVLHSGPDGIQAQVWRVEEATPDRVRFALDLPDGQGGFPGERTVAAEYRLEGADLHLSLSATTDRPTLMNVVSHGVWNLDGAPDWDGHRLEVPAERYLPIDDETIPTGEIADVAGTPYDHRVLRAPEPTLDHNFCFAPAAAPRRLARLVAPSGRELHLLSDAPGLQVYTRRPAGIALEAQLWPDAPHHPGFPSIRLGPGEVFRQTTIFRFSGGA